MIDRIDRSLWIKCEYEEEPVAREMRARNVCKPELSDTINGVSAKSYSINESKDESTSDRHLHVGLQRRNSVNKSDAAFHLSQSIRPRRCFHPMLSHTISNSNA